MAKPGWMRDLDVDQVSFYQHLSPEQAVCRGKRRHDFPGIVPGKPLPASIAVERSAGVYQVTEHCERGCGRFITYLTSRAGVPDYSTVRYGGGGPNYLATGLGLTAADDRLHMAYQQADTIREAYRVAELGRTSPERQESLQRIAAAREGAAKFIAEREGVPG